MVKTGKPIGRPRSIAQIAAERGMSEMALMASMLTRYERLSDVAAELGTSERTVDRWCDAHGAVRKTTVTIPVVLEVPQV